MLEFFFFFSVNIQYLELLNLLRVSSEGDVSNDEDVEVEDDSSLDSFIDDRMNSTAITQPGASRVDMMAIYRFCVFFLFISFLSLLVFIVFSLGFLVKVGKQTCMNRSRSLSL